MRRGFLPSCRNFSLPAPKKPMRIEVLCIWCRNSQCIRLDSRQLDGHKRLYPPDETYTLRFHQSSCFWSRQGLGTAAPVGFDGSFGLRFVVECGLSPPAVRLHIKKHATDTDPLFSSYFSSQSNTRFYKPSKCWWSFALRFLCTSFELHPFWFGCHEIHGMGVRIAR